MSEKQMTEQERKDYWEARRESMIVYLKQPIHGIKKNVAFNSKTVAHIVDNFIDSMVFAGLPEKLPPKTEIVQTAWGDVELLSGARQ